MHDNHDNLERSNSNFQGISGKFIYGGFGLFGVMLKGNSGEEPFSRKIYVTVHRFKDHLYEQRTSFNRRSEKPTKLSDHVWKL